MERDAHRNLKAFSLAALALIAFSACRLKSPSVAEQQYLIEKGAFPAGLPAWAAGPGGAKRASSGLIPETFSGPSAVANASAISPTAAEQPTGDNPAVKGNQATQEAPTSPLDRIAQICPNVEPDVPRAITTTEPGERTRLFSSLVNRCPQSADLWLWLGQAYANQKKTVEARKALERAHVIEPQDKAISDALEKLDTQKK